MARSVSTIWLLHTPSGLPALSGARLNANAARALANSVLGTTDLTMSAPRPLSEISAGDAAVLYVGAYSGATVIVSPWFAADQPSQLPPSKRLTAERTVVITTDSARRWGAFALWEGARLRRSFSATATDILENEGLPEAWEQPFWAGKHPIKVPNGAVAHPDWLPFHPQHFAESANAAWLGFRYTGVRPDDAVRPTELLVAGFTVGAQLALPAPHPNEPTEAENAERPAAPSSSESAEPSLWRRLTGRGSRQRARS